MESQKRFIKYVHRFFLERLPSIEERNHRHFVILNIMIFFGTFTHTSWILLFWLLDVKLLALFNIISVSAWLLSMFLNRKGLHLVSMTVAGIEVVAHQTLCVLIIGWSAGFQYYILLIPIAIFLMPSGRNFLKILIVIFCLLDYATLDYFFRNAEPMKNLDIAVLSIFNYSNIMVFVVLSALVPYYFNAKVDEAEEALHEEHKKSEMLLHNILPVPIASRLKSNNQTLVDGFDETSILFADIVGFTSLSEKSSPETLVAMLNDIFSRFDDLTEKHGLEKIKTIGDAYMAAAGIPEPHENHAVAIADMALDMIKVLKQPNDTFGKSFNIRIGINSGPVVAGVIGKKKFTYDLWGDSVNTAARMESHGVSGEIQVTKDTYNLLKDEYIFEERGDIDVKGKGLMMAYFLKGRKTL